MMSMSDEHLLDGSSYDYKLTKDMLGTSLTSLSSPHNENTQPCSPSMKSPRIPNFLNSPSPTVSFALREKQYGISNGDSTNNNHSTNSSNFNSRTHDLAITDLGSSILGYKKEIQMQEGKKREELLNSQVSLLEVYRNKIASNNLAMEEMKQEYERKLYQQKVELNELHQAELHKLREEESNRQFTDQVRIGTIKDKLKSKYEIKIQAFQQDVEDTRTALYNKKLQIQGSVDYANREITTLRLQQESTQRIHQNEIQQKEDHITELQTLVAESKGTQMQNEELIRCGVEIAALVIHMHQKARPLSTEDLDVEELYKYLHVNSATTLPTGAGDKTKDQVSSQTIVPTAYLQKALGSSKVLDWQEVFFCLMLMSNCSILIQHFVLRALIPFLINLHVL